MVYGSLGLLIGTFLIFIGNPLIGFLSGLLFNTSLTLLGLTSLNSILIISVGSLGISGVIHPYSSIGFLFGLYASSSITNAYRSLNPELTNDIDYLIGNSQDSLREAIIEIQMDSTYSAYSLGFTFIIFLLGMNDFILLHYKGISLFLISISSFVALIAWSFYFLHLKNKDKFIWLLGLLLSLLFSLFISFILKDSNFNNLSIVLPIILLNIPLPSFKRKRVFKFDKVFGPGVNANELSNSSLASILSGLLILNSNSMLLELFTHTQKNSIISDYDKDLYSTELAIGRAIHSNLQFLSWSLFGIGRLGEMDGINNILDAWNIDNFIFVPLLLITLFLKVYWIPQHAEHLLHFIHLHSIPSFWGNSLLILLSSFASLFLLSFDFNLWFLLCLFIAFISLLKASLPKHLTKFTLAPLLLPILLSFPFS